MNLFKKAATGALALMLTVGVAGTAVAQSDTGDVDVEITTLAEGGVLAVSIGDLNFGEFPYALETRTPTGTITINASDMRGTAAGWNVTLSGTDFSTGGATPITFGISNLSLPTGNVNHVNAGSGHATSTLPVPTAASPVSATAATVLSAPVGTGAGKYENQRPGTALTIPGGTLVGAYQSTLTVTITGADPVAP